MCFFTPTLMHETLRHFTIDIIIETFRCRNISSMTLRDWLSMRTLRHFLSFSPRWHFSFQDFMRYRLFFIADELFITLLRAFFLFSRLFSMPRIDERHLSLLRSIIVKHATLLHVPLLIIIVSRHYHYFYRRLFHYEPYIAAAESLFFFRWCYATFFSAATKHFIAATKADDVRLRKYYERGYFITADVSLPFSPTAHYADITVPMKPMFSKHETRLSITHFDTSDYAFFSPPTTFLRRAITTNTVKYHWWWLSLFFDYRLRFFYYLCETCRFDAIDIVIFHIIAGERHFMADADVRVAGPLYFDFRATFHWWVITVTYHENISRISIDFIS